MSCQTCYQGSFSTNEKTKAWLADLKNELFLTFHICYNSICKKMKRIPTTLRLKLDGILFFNNIYIGKKTDTPDEQKIV